MAFRAVCKPLPHPPNVEDVATARRFLVGTWRSTLDANAVDGVKLNWENRKSAERQRQLWIMGDTTYYRKFYPDGRLKQRLGPLIWDDKRQRVTVHRPRKSAWRTHADEKYEILGREGEWFAIRIVNTVITDPRSVPGEMVPELRRIEYFCITANTLEISRDRGKTWSSWHRVPEF